MRLSRIPFLFLLTFVALLTAQPKPVDVLEGLWPDGFTITGGATLKVQKVDRGGMKDGMFASVAEKKANAWDVSLMAVLRSPILKGDVVYFSFHARSVDKAGGKGTFAFALQKNSPDWKTLVSGNAEVAGEWKRFSAVAKSEGPWSAGDIKAVLMLGGQKQDLEFSGIQVLNFGGETSLDDAKRLGDGREPSPQKPAGKYSFKGDSEKNPLTYKVGESIVFKVQLLMDGNPVEGKNLAWKTVGDDGSTNEGKALSTTNGPLVIKANLGKPGFVRVIVYPQDVLGGPLKNGNQNVQAFDGGAGADIDKIQGWKEPADFDGYWKKQVARLKTVPVRADQVGVDSSDADVLVFDMKIDCPGKMPVSGYFCKPKTAGAKSLPIRLSYNGYGVGSAYKPLSKTALTLNINAHGIENGKTPDFYAKLKATTLSNYAFFEEENRNPDTAYFNGMVLRLLRAAEFMKTQPEWDGSNLIVSGGSQGGWQCLIAAALDPQVSRCEASIPWCCDLGGVNMGRMPGWRPNWVDGLGYYDAANHAKRIKCPTTIYAGLGDYTCPPSGEVVLFRNIPAPVKLDFAQGRTHGYTMPGGAIYTLTKNWKE